MDIGLPCFVETKKGYKYLGNCSQLLDYISECCGTETSDIVCNIMDYAKSNKEYQEQKALLDCDALMEDIESFEDACQNISNLLEKFEEYNREYKQLSSDKVSEFIDSIQRHLDEVL